MPLFSEVQYKAKMRISDGIVVADNIIINAIFVIILKKML